jgi:cell division protein FtsB
MNFPFSTLADAREQYSKLSEEAIGLTAKIAEFDALSKANTDLLAEREALSLDNHALKAQIETISKDSGLAIVAKDGVIATLQSEKTALEASVVELKKNQKTVKATARELVAASAAGAPASVDGSEVEELAGPELMKAIKAEKDPVKMDQMYQLYKKQSSQQ